MRAIAALLVALSTLGAAAPVIRVGEPPGFQVSVSPLDIGGVARVIEREPDRAGWRLLLAVFAGSEGAVPVGQPALLGTFGGSGDTILFASRFDPDPGLTVTALFDGPLFDLLAGLPPGTTPRLERQYLLPGGDPAPSTRVEAVYPSGPEVPANLLRLYVHFSAPMRGIELGRWLQLLDSDGQPVDTPFVEVEGGLWGPEKKRLTLFFHPGRIKRGVGPHLALGPPLREGETYRLVIDSNMRDGRGVALAEGYEHSFRVGPPDRRSPVPASFVVGPLGGGREALVVVLGEPLDRALLERFIWIEAGGARVPGRVEVEEQETVWSFMPVEPWGEAKHELVINPRLEDLAGNRVDRLFDEAGSTASRPIRAPLRIPVPRTP